MTRDADATADDAVADPTGGDLPPIDCTLTEDEAERRNDWAREHLLPHLAEVERRDDGYTFVFERSADAYAAVAEAAWKESQCCSWATFEVVLPPGDGPIEWRERSDRDGGDELFETVFEEFETVPAPE